MMQFITVHKSIEKAMMLEKPDVHDEKVMACLRGEYGLSLTQLTFLPLGADINTAVYRAVTETGAPFFVKLRSGEFDETSVAIPKHFHRQGIEQIIEPLTTKSGQLWANLDGYHVLLYPYVEGQGGFDINLSDEHWVTFGRALKAIHSTAIPPALAGLIQRETYSPRFREIVKGFQQQIETHSFADPVAIKLVALLRDKKDVVDHLVKRAEQLAKILKAERTASVLCHSDIHAGNILISEDHRLFIVDWDQPIFAPKERDLMFVGGGLGGGGHTPEQEEKLFYQGYGPVEINYLALAYYRYERIVADIAAYCDQILGTDEGGQDREEGFQQIRSQFLPDAVIDIAYQSEKHLPPELQAGVH